MAVPNRNSISLSRLSRCLVFLCCELRGQSFILYTHLLTSLKIHLKNVAQYFCLRRIIDGKNLAKSTRRNTRTSRHFYPVVVELCTPVTCTRTKSKRRLLEKKVGGVTLTRIPFLLYSTKAVYLYDLLIYSIYILVNSIQKLGQSNMEQR